MDGQPMTTGQRLEAAFGNLPEGGIMTGKSKFCGASWTPTLCAIGFLMGSLMESVVLAAQDEETTRRLWDTAFIEPKKKASTNRQYRPVTPSIPPVRVPEDTVIGITVWRLRPSKPGDQGARLVIHDGANIVEWTPERVQADTTFSRGERVRLSVEAARTGYLYVINREQNADGTSSEPYLIYPTKRTHGGHNEVKPGRVIEIPAQEDSPPYFTLRPNRPGQVSEVLSVLVTTGPIESLQIGDQPLKLSNDQVAMWEKSWGTQVGRLEMESGVGKLWTQEEKEAAADTTRLLVQEDPGPQTLFYRPDIKSGDPLLATFRLRYGGPDPPLQRLDKNQRSIH